MPELIQTDLYICNCKIYFESTGDVASDKLIKGTFKELLMDMEKLRDEIVNLRIQLIRN